MFHTLEFSLKDGVACYGVNNFVVGMFCVIRGCCSCTIYRKIRQKISTSKIHMACGLRVNHSILENISILGWQTAEVYLATARSILRCNIPEQMFHLGRCGNK